MKDLPHPADVIEARDWLHAGAPAAAANHDPIKSVRTLLALIEALPSYHKLYCYGTPEYKQAMQEKEE